MTDQEPKWDDGQYYMAVRVHPAAIQHYEQQARRQAFLSRVLFVLLGMALTVVLWVIFLPHGISVDIDYLCAVAHTAAAAPEGARVEIVVRGAMLPQTEEPRVVIFCASPAAQGQ